MKTYIIVDLGFGDAGKGTTIDFLSRLTPNTLIIRYNGGPQAAHNVETKQVHHTFAQFGSGTLVPSVKTYLSEYMWVEPLSLLAENEGLQRIGVTDALSRLYINRRTRLVTPFHKAANRIKERVNKHGSCGVGMGEAVFDSLDGLVLTIEDLECRDKALQILNNIQEKKREECRFDTSRDMETLLDPNAPVLCWNIYQELLSKITVVDDINYNGYEQVLFEGACGILLDENYGFHPHTMWTSTTTENARKLWTEEATTLGIIRTYSTRHGNGPFPTETALPFIDRHNIPNNWQGGFRTGVFDLAATKYALRVNGGVDALVVTHTDEKCPVICEAYPEIDEFNPTKGDLNKQQTLTDSLWGCNPDITAITRPFIEEISERLDLPVFIESFGARDCDKRLY